MSEVLGPDLSAELKECFDNRKVPIGDRIKHARSFAKELGEVSVLVAKTRVEDGEPIGDDLVKDDEIHSITQKYGFPEIKRERKGIKTIDVPSEVHPDLVLRVQEGAVDQCGAPGGKAWNQNNHTDTISIVVRRAA